MAENQQLSSDDRLDIDVPLRERDGLAVWAAKDCPFKPDDVGENRTLFKHDGDEVIYSAAFRRLSDKSQVVVKPERIENFRSRLTHTLEVNQIAESIGIQLKLNIPLINAIALGHDIGHAPFGHAGERQFQDIVRNDVLPLCDSNKLVQKLKGNYGVEIKFNIDTGECKNKHWLFHHAINSQRIIQRKFKDISDETLSGVLTHSWSPWQPDSKCKFGIPITYEAQVVAIADQVAGINHDTEDILNCEESTYTVNKIYEEIPEYIIENGFLDEHSKVLDILSVWFLKKDDCKKEKGWGRKQRLRKVINNTVAASIKTLKANSVDSCIHATDVPLNLDEPIARFLEGYERYIRDKIIGEVLWFKQRDAQAAAGTWAVYSFFKHCGTPQGNVENRHSNYLHAEVKEAIDRFKKSVNEEQYYRDEYWKILVDSAKSGKGDDVKHMMQTVDYVSGMTDRHLMKVYDIALNLFD